MAAEEMHAAVYDMKCDLAFRHVYDSYAGAGASVYEARG